MGCGLKQGLFLADIAFAWIIVFPMGVFYWRGTWDIWTSYVNLDCRDDGNVDRPGEDRYRHRIPGYRSDEDDDDDECEEVHGLWLSAVVGATVCTFINIMSPLLIKYVDPKRMHIVLYVIITRLYCYIMAFCNMGYWRGAWSLMDHYGDSSWRSNLIALAASLALAWVCRVSIQAKSLPWETGSDLKALKSSDMLFESGTWLGRTVAKDGWWLWCVDQVLSQVFVQSLSIFVWRCFWNVIDKTIITWDKTLSAGVTLGAGLGWLLILALIFQHPMSSLSAKLDSKPLFWKVVVEDFWFVLVNAGVVLSWRGAWYLVADYVLPDPIVGGWTCHAIGFVVLVIVQQSNAVFDNGVSVDADNTGGKGVKTKIDFFQYIFRDQIAKREGGNLKGNGNFTQNGFGSSGKNQYGINGGDVEGVDTFYNNAYDASEKL